MPSRTRHDPLAACNQPRWLTVAGLHGEALEAPQLAPGTDLAAAMADALARLAGDGVVKRSAQVLPPVAMPVVRAQSPCVQNPGINVAIANLADRIGGEPRKSDMALKQTCIILAIIDTLAGERVHIATDTLRGDFADWYGPSALQMRSGAARAIMLTDLAKLHRALRTH